MPNQNLTETLSTQAASSFFSLSISPGKVIRGAGVLSTVGAQVANLGTRPLIVAGNHTLNLSKEHLKPLFQSQQLHSILVSYGADCCETSLKALRKAAKEHKADIIIGIGGGKALDTAKLVAHQLTLPVITIPTSAATCAAWTALSNVYSTTGAFLYDVALSRCPELLILDYNLIQTAPQRTLVAGIGDAIAKWYEASVSSGNSQQTLIIAAVQQARVLRDILLQKSATALQSPGTEIWQEVVDATVLLAGVIGGLGGAQCRTVAAHAVHNGLTHISGHNSIHGEKVAYGILVQLRLEEMIQGNQLAASARQQLLKFYAEIGLPQKLADLGLGNITLGELQTAAEISLEPNSDIHRLPFKVALEQLMAAMVSTTAPIDINRVSIRGISDEVKE
ncbi:iron-containing alcohol dehydrogenase family protein [Dolichospermum circinale CS-1225]|uniref:iron-containing alcohol dehydrogenase family protein n=1 Tax=Dolichospermum circinale TaxID=109265 RepID=UPI00232F4A1A|nr:iron-containing alcohol dehydrogenase family protein [Dolichospermum circinale]MDB9467962.1 iron-containing alcohol dehydrogenase family protein [Dolichospermum circinale CS-539/09]MDB9469304.1 iron-containing alcohol dehydrogenase family protein [Dolichospermum circinale CS-539]MDB9523472.1 iron-containing alcohol dehydrogenase family protein [Dolichospermum circinale CS-1225]